MAFRDKTLDKSQIRIPSSLFLLIVKFYLFNFVCLDLVEIYYFFLANLSRRPKWAFLVKICPLYVIVVDMGVVVVTFPISIFSSRTTGPI